MRKLKIPLDRKRVTKRNKPNPKVGTHGKKYREITKPFTSSIKDIGFCETQNQSFREEMEDGHCIWEAFRGKNSECFFGVYDGHGGIAAVDYVESNLHENFKIGLNKFKRVSDAFVYAYKKTDMEMIEKHVHVNHCGATSITSFLTETNNVRRLFTANCGDSRGVLCRKGGVAQRISYDHKASDYDEMRRVQESGGIILEDRVQGVLAISRSFGDSDYKKWVVCDPFITEITLESTDEFLILACDGVWDVISDQEAVDLCLQKELKMDAQLMAQKLMSRALTKGSMDNISVLVVVL